jgi:hypothetical protein
VFGLVGISIQASGLAGSLAERGLLVFDALGGAFWLSWFMAIGVLIMWFPTGRVPSPRWMWLQWWGLGTVALTFVLYLFADQLCAVYDDEAGCVEYVSNPIGISGVPNPEYGWISGPLFTGAALFILGSLVSLAMRYRVSRGGERQQIKWFLLACAAFGLTFVSLLITEALGMSEPPSWLDVAMLLTVAAVPVSATVAILRYRLYDIDRIISRTVTYALVVGLLVAVVALVAAMVGTRFEEPLVVAATTLGVAAVFNPLRRRVQSVVDRRFNRSRYDAERVMSEFAGALRDRVDHDGVVGGWVGVVSQTMQPSGVGVWVRDS